MSESNSTAQAEQVSQYRTSEVSARYLASNLAGTGWPDLAVADVLAWDTVGASSSPEDIWSTGGLRVRPRAQIESNETLPSKLLVHLTCYLQIVHLIDDSSHNATGPETADRFAVSIRNIIQEYGRIALGSARDLLNRSGTKILAREFVQILGDVRSPETVAERQWMLLTMLEHEDAGMRMAAASALGNIGGIGATKALARRLGREKNRFVLQMIRAHLQAEDKHDNPAEA